MRLFSTWLLAIEQERVDKITHFFFFLHVCFYGIIHMIPKFTLVSHLLKILSLSFNQITRIMHVTGLEWLSSIVKVHRELSLEHRVVFHLTADS